MWVQPLGREDLLEEGMATPFSVLAWRIPWTEEPVGQSPWGRKELQTTEPTQHACTPMSTVKMAKTGYQAFLQTQLKSGFISQNSLPSLGEILLTAGTIDLTSQAQYNHLQSFSCKNLAAHTNYTFLWEVGPSTELLKLPGDSNMQSRSKHHWSKYGHSTTVSQRFCVFMALGP